MEFYFPVTANRKQCRKKINSNCISWLCFKSIRYSRKEKRIWKIEIDGLFGKKSERIKTWTVKGEGSSYSMPTLPFLWVRGQWVWNWPFFHSKIARCYINVLVFIFIFICYLVFSYSVQERLLSKVLALWSLDFCICMLCLCELM